MQPDAPRPLLVPFDAPVVRGRFVRRYKRFFVDVLLDPDPADGAPQPVTAHTANTGSMAGLLVEGAPVLLTRHDGKGRQLPLELEAIEVDGAWVGVNTGTANRFVAAAIAAGLVEPLRGYQTVRSEVRPSPRSHSRLDLHLQHDPPRDNDGGCFVEVKSVTLRDGERALFPDAVSVRGKKHLDALARLAKKEGTRAATVYLLRRSDCTSFAPADDIDPAYGAALRRALKAGVVACCVVAHVDERGLSFGGALPIAGRAP